MSGPDPIATLREGGKAALARALSQVEAWPSAPPTVRLLDAALEAQVGHAIGLTGPPGVGKSSLIDGLVRVWRRRGRSVGVIAVDPSSARSGGSLLGDRARIVSNPDDAGIFVRSMAARDRLGGVADITFPAIVLMRAVFDRVIVETVGIGQSETAVAGLVDTVVLCAQPASGDALQYMKAGVMEIPHIAVVTKADLGAHAARTVSDLKGALSVAGGPDGAPPEVIPASAHAGTGIGDLVTAIDRRSDGGDQNAALARQISAWRTAHLAHRYGRVGLALIGETPAERPGTLGGAAVTVATTGPFTDAARQYDRLDRAFRETLTRLDAGDDPTC